MLCVGLGTMDHLVVLLIAKKVVKIFCPKVVKIFCPKVVKIFCPIKLFSGNPSLWDFGCEVGGGLGNLHSPLLYTPYGVILTMRRHPPLYYRYTTRIWYALSLGSSNIQTDFDSCVAFGPRPFPRASHLHSIANLRPRLSRTRGGCGRQPA
eukprot:SAG11_NODE_5031_length_1685_cov_1.457125_2_plen_151_part_00